MKLTDLQKEVSPVWEEKGYEVLKYDREAVKQKTMRLSARLTNHTTV